MSAPKRIESGLHKGKVRCTQYSCLNNFGLQTGLIHDASYPSGYCKVVDPNITDFGNEVWGCSHEKYSDTVSSNVKKVPAECYGEFGQDLDGCSTQENEGCARCSLYK